MGLYRYNNAINHPFLGMVSLDQLSMVMTGGWVIIVIPTLEKFTCIDCENESWYSIYTYFFKPLSILINSSVGKWKCSMFPDTPTSIQPIQLFGDSPSPGTSGISCWIRTSCSSRSFSSKADLYLRDPRQLDQRECFCRLRSLKMSAKKMDCLIRMIYV